ncbi:MAG TPA: hypothetical protein PLG90_07080, partial [Ignavibacteria bacterium]|nr:hypothetical protein [Ignavibacteria bacterium]
PAGYGKTSLSAEYFDTIKKDLKIWISLSSYDNSIENFFLLLALAFQKNIPDSTFSESIKKIIATNQNTTLENKIFNLIASFSNDLFLYLEKKKKNIHIFLDDFHNIDESDEVCAALNYFMDYLSSNVHFVFITRRNPDKINYTKFLAKNWLGRITKDDLAFSESDYNKFFTLLKKKNKKIIIEKDLLQKFLESTEGWITAVQLILLVNDFDRVKLENIANSKVDLFNYFSNEITNQLTKEEKKFLYLTSYLEYLDKNIIENVLGFKNGYELILKFFNSNLFINKEGDVFKYHELFKEYLNKNSLTHLKTNELTKLFNVLGKHYLNNGDWRSEYIALNYLIDAKDYQTVRNWIRLYATEKLFLIHSSNLYNKILEIEDQNFKDSLEYILLNVNTYVYIEKNLDKTLSYLRNLLIKRFKLKNHDEILIPKSKLKKQDLLYYTEILMLISNCNFLKYGISPVNIDIAKHILTFKLTPDQEIQFLITLIKTYITTGKNSENTDLIIRLKKIFKKLMNEFEEGKKSSKDNNFIESIFSLLIFFDYGDYKTGNLVINFIKSNFDVERFDLSNFSQLCFALFTSYNLKDYNFYFEKLKEKNKEKNKTLFLAYKNQFEFQKVLQRFLTLEIRETINQLENIKRNTYLKNYIYFIDSLILFCFNLINQPAKVIYYLENTEEYAVSKTRKLILELESYILLNEPQKIKNLFNEINKIKKENFTLFNQAFILLCESYLYAINDELANFKTTFSGFINLSEKYGYENYILFRSKLNKLNYVFSYAFKNKICIDYLNSVFNNAKVSKPVSDKIEISIKVNFLDNNEIYINNKLIEDEIWERPKSKLIMIFLLLKTYNKKDITKEIIINELFYNTNSNNLNAVIDVELNKVRKSLQMFFIRNISGFDVKDVLGIKDKKYSFLNEKYNINFYFDIYEFLKNCESNDIENNESAVSLFKNEFLPNIYLNWVEDIRENLKYNFQKVTSNLLSYYQKNKRFDKYINLLEKLYLFDPSDENVTGELLNIYNKTEDFSKMKFIYELHKKALKKEYDISEEKYVNYFKDIKSRFKI